MKKSQKGFTLIELLGILILIAIIAVISFVVIDRVMKSGKEKMYNNQIETIELATRNYYADRLNQLPQFNQEITLPLGALKIAGYVEDDIANPNTGLCFSNDETLITIKQVYDETTNSYKDSYTYKVTQTGFLECDHNTILPSGGGNDESNVQPYIAAVAVSETVGEGNNDKVFTAFYNLANLDTSKISIENLSSIASTSEFNMVISEPIVLEHGYQINIGWEVGTFTQTEEVLTLVIEQGALKNAEGVKSEKVTAAVHYNNAPLSWDSIVKFSQTLGYGPSTSTEEYLAGNLKFLTTDEWIAQEAVFPVEGHYSVGCHSVRVIGTSTELVGNTSYQGIKFKVTDLDYISYEVTEKSGRLNFEKITGHVENPADNPITIKVHDNGAYDLKLCTETNQCTTREIILSKSDCSIPSIDLSGSNKSLKLTNITNDSGTGYDWNYLGYDYASNQEVTVLADIKSGIYSWGAFISPFGPEDTLINHISHGTTRGNILESYAGIYGKAYGLLDLGINGSNTLNEVITKAEELNHSCSDLHLYIELLDNAGNRSVNYYGTVQDADCDDYEDYDYGSMSTCDSGNTVADMYCQMRQNSNNWYSDMTLEEKNELNATNIALANQIQFELHSDGLYDLNSNQITYSISEGAYYSCGSGNCVNLYDQSIVTSSDSFAEGDLIDVTNSEN